MDLWNGVKAELNLFKNGLLANPQTRDKSLQLCKTAYKTNTKFPLE